MVLLAGVVMFLISVLIHGWAFWVLLIGGIVVSLIGGLKAQKIEDMERDRKRRGYLP